jgi:hypothetical protein
MKKVLVVAVALVFVLSAMAFGGANPTAKTAIHVRAHSAKAGCTITPPIVTCAEINTTEPSTSVDAFTIHFGLTGHLGTSYGVCWPPEWGSAGWNSCTTLTVGAIYFSGDGASHTWTECQYTGVAVSSYLWLYAYTPGVICPCPHPGTGKNEVLDCWQGKDEPICTFCAYAGDAGGVGDDPCDPTGVEQSTWGGIKAIFE